MKKKLGFLVAVVACLVFAFTALSACGDTPPENNSVKATISQTEVTLVKLGSTELTVTVSDPNIDIAWGVEDTNVVTITTKGKKATVKAVGSGTTKVTVKNKADGTLLASCDVTVTEPKLYINLPYGLVLRSGGSVATVKAIANAELKGDIYWELSNDEYASVEYQGLIARVTAKKVGRNPDGDAILTVHYGDESASIPVYVGIK